MTIIEYNVEKNYDKIIEKMNNHFKNYGGKYSDIFGTHNEVIFIGYKETKGVDLGGNTKNIRSFESFFETEHGNLLTENKSKKARSIA